MNESRTPAAPGLFGQQLTLMEEIRAATFKVHAGMQGAPYFEALAACRLPLESYVGQLRALAVIHGVLEETLASCADPRVAAVWQDDMRKVPLLQLNALELSAGERAGIAEAASDLFKRIEAVFLALYPFAPESKTFLVTSINPEAGRHAVPADPREVHASLKAGDLCWERFPYYEHRYGERGRRFARSDAAWQATLYRYEPAQILQQVQWLGRVLAGRGMPTVLLQIQLEILVDELAAAVPENKAQYERLRLAAADLLASRRKHLSDDQIRGIAADFDRAVGPEWTARFPHTGTLLGCAVADELEGSDGAVTSLRPWMTDADRFPAVWIAAVDAALAQARTLAGKEA